MSLPKPSVIRFSKPAGATHILVIVFSLLLPVFSLRADDDFANGTANIGERLFLETRFAEFFYTNSGGNANAILANSDSVVSNEASIYGPLPGPFAGYSMNCRQCHTVEEEETANNNAIFPSFETGNRTYCDFARRSPIPNLGDGRLTTSRNAMPLVDSLLPRSVPLFLHFDGQFATPQDLVIGTMTGRNFGWQPAQYATAIHNIAHIIRCDNGTGALAQQYGGYSYATAFQGLAEVTLPYLISPPYRMDVTITDPSDPDYVTDNEIVQNVAALIQAYMETLVFSQDTNGQFNGSPYDTFLIKNGLPRAPGTGETPLHYSQRLLQLINNLTNLNYVSNGVDGTLMTQNQSFQFGTNELAGLKIFFALGASNGIGPGMVGNCVACHTPPAFSDFIFHNTGTAQEEYDSIFGNGSFLALSVPNLATRQGSYNAYLPPTTNHPYATGTFETPPSAGNPGQVDLGLWNVFANTDFPAPQPGLQQILPQLIPGGLPPPLIQNAATMGHNFTLNGANGVPNWTYYVLASTNLTLPVSQWQVLQTNSFDALGHFAFTNTVTGAAPRQFYRLSLDMTAPALPYMIGLFKTPTVRDLASSEPYFHTGRMNTIEDAINFYSTFSAKARAGLVRNADPRLSGVLLDTNVTPQIAAFIRSLNEDYTDIPCPCQ